MIIPHRERGAPAPFASLTRESARLFPALVAELRERTGMDVGYRRAPLLEVAFDEMEEHELRRQRDWEIGQGLNVPWLDRRSALDVEPSLNPAIRGGLLYEDDHQLLPQQFARALARAASDLGAVVRERSSADQLGIESDQVVGAQLGNESIRAETVVIATGAWSASWSRSVGIAIPVRPVRGQIVALHTAGTALRAVISGAGGYALTKPDGRTLVGTTVEDAGFDARPTVEAIASLLARATALSPRLAQASVVSAWAGLRPGTPDNLPIIGRLRERQRAILATGHFRNGILLAPITAELVCDLVLRRTPRLDLGLFEPERFMVRAA
jgi:glycine oxidase